MEGLSGWVSQGVGGLLVYMGAARCVLLWQFLGLSRRWFLALLLRFRVLFYGFFALL